MPRAPNFGYQDPTQDIGNSLVRAIFGDPAAAQQQRKLQSEAALRTAQTGEATAHGRLFGSQADGQDGQNTASASLPALFANLAPRPTEQGDPSQPTVPVDPGFAHFAPPADVPMAAPAPAAPPPSPDQAFRAGLPALMAAMSQARGDKMDPSATVATLASFLGGEEMARRGQISQGHTPGKDFAITPERADTIASTQSASDLAQAIGTAHENHATDFGVARIHAASAGNVATINNRDNIPVANIQAASAANVAGIRTGSGTSRGEKNNNPGNIEMGPFARSQGATGTDGRFATFPTYEAGVRAQEALLGGSGYLGAGRNTIDRIISHYAPPSDGNNIDNYGDYVSRVTGIPRGQPIGAAQIPVVAQAMRQFELGHSEKPGKAAKAAPVKFVSTANAKQITDAVDAYFAGAGVTLSDSNKATIYAQAITHFQQSGNPVLAVQQTIQDRVAKNRAFRDQQAEARSQPSGVLQEQQARLATETARANAHGARQAPDGKWYVRTGTKPNGQPAYSRYETGAQDAPASPRASAFSPAPRTVRGVVQVSNPAEAMGLAPGTPYVTHDGRAMVR